MRKKVIGQLKFLSDDRGISLVMVLFALVLVSIVGVSVAAVASNNLTQSKGEQESQSAYYIAEGGAIKTMTEIENSITAIKAASTSQTNFYTNFESDLFSVKTIESFTLNGTEQPIATVKIEKVSNSSPRKYKLISVGEIGKRKREVSGYFTVDYTQGNGFSIPTNLSLYTEDRIELSGGAQVNGSVGTNLKSKGSIKLDGGAGISKQILVPVGSDANPIEAPSYLLDNHISKVTNFSEKILPHELPKFPVYPSFQQMGNVSIGEHKVIDNGNLNITSWQAQNYILKLTANASFKDINISQNNKLVIEVGNKDKAIVVENLNLNNGEIQINGTGKLTIYVRNNMAFGSGSFNLNGNRNQLEIYWKGTPVNSTKKTIVIAANMKINGSLYAENANLTFTEGGGFLGHVLTGGDHLIISGGARVGSSLILAPKAKVQLLAGGKMDGSIISNSYYGDGGTILKYVPIDHASIPQITEIGATEKNVKFASQPFRES